MALIRAGKLVDSAGAANMGADVYSSGIAAGITDVANLAVLALQQSGKAGLQILVDNTNAVGTLYVQGSFDGEHWVNIVFLSGASSIPVTTGTDVNALLDLADLGFPYLRVFYDYTSGDGLLDVFAQAK